MTSSHYDVSDLHRLLSAAPLRQLYQPQAAGRLLEHAVQTGAELDSVLQGYPAVRYQALDFQYVCLQSLGALDEDLLEDLCHAVGQPGRLWAAFLALLAPDECFEPHLQASLREGLEPHWLTALALDAVQGRWPSQHQRIRSLLWMLGQQLSTLPLPSVRLRRASTLEQGSSIQHTLRQAYQARGLSAALQVLRCTRD